MALWAPVAMAQTKEARLFDEFGDLPCGDVQSRLDRFLAAFYEDTHMTGAMIFYEGKYSETVERNGREIERVLLPTFGEIHRRVHRIENYIRFRGFPLERLRFVSGGLRERAWFELWIVPRNVKLPTPRTELKHLSYRRGRPTYFGCN